MLRKLTLLLLLLLTVVPLAARTPRFAFDKRGRFRIMQLTDLHFTGDERSAHLPAMLTRLIEAEHPDLIVVTGDVVYDQRGRRTDAELWSEICGVIARTKVPYLVTLGNHDSERTPRPETYAIVRALPGCLNGEFNAAGERQGDFVVPIFTADGRREGALLYLLDSNDYNDDHTYAGVSEEQVAWYRARSGEAEARNGAKVNALMFFHIPLAEFAEAYDSGRRHEGFRLEKECPGRDNHGLFEALVERGEVTGVFVGHDHANNYIASMEGIALAYGRYSGGYGVYQELLSGCRMIELREGVRGFRTWERLANMRTLREVVVPDYFN